MNGRSLVCDLSWIFSSPFDANDFSQNVQFKGLPLIDFKWSCNAFKEKNLRSVGKKIKKFVIVIYII